MDRIGSSRNWTGEGHRRQRIEDDYEQKYLSSVIISFYNALLQITLELHNYLENTTIICTIIIINIIYYFYHYYYAYYTTTTTTTTDTNTRLIITFILPMVNKIPQKLNNSLVVKFRAHGPHLSHLTLSYIIYHCYYHYYNNNNYYYSHRHHHHHHISPGPDDHTETRNYL